MRGYAVPSYGNTDTPGGRILLFEYTGPVALIGTAAQLFQTGEDPGMTSSAVESSPLEVHVRDEEEKDE